MLTVQSLTLRLLKNYCDYVVFLGDDCKRTDSEMTERGLWDDSDKSGKWLRYYSEMTG